MDEIKEPLCSVCNTAVAAFDDGFILFLLFLSVVFLVFVLIVFLDEKKDVEFFNTAPDADDDILCS